MYPPAHCVPSVPSAESGTGESGACGGGVEPTLEEKDMLCSIGLADCCDESRGEDGFESGGDLRGTSRVFPPSAASSSSSSFTARPSLGLCGLFRP